MYVKKCVHKYVKSYTGQTKWICFSIEDDGLWKKCLNIWDKVSGDIKKRLKIFTIKKYLR